GRDGWRGSGNLVPGRRAGGGAGVAVVARRLGPVGRRGQPADVEPERVRVPAVDAHPLAHPGRREARVLAALREHRELEAGGGRVAPCANGPGEDVAGTVRGHVRAAVPLRGGSRGGEGGERQAEADEPEN